jgi:toxin ParE1/3/4
MPNIVKRPLAEKDLNDIWDYIAEDNLDQANEFLRSLNRKIVLLAETPMMGRARDELALALRSFPVGRYIIFYRPIQDGVEVVRVLHGAQDISAQHFSF